MRRNVQSPSVDTPLKITEALGISLIDLFDISEDLPTDLFLAIN
ncbi:hypothetical protein BAOM_0925 [Peribacillus asahii]|uniref:XRE family transcriptional regulator n=1 Tax=Peribacillus asahii TaxID=228899 RepID=A0A3Q9RLH4_9BACI|nr:hypothetical protein BAOM_0925 [Peribacillus asahii]